MHLISDVKKAFEREFSSLLDKFKVFELELEAAANNSDNDVNSPGVYMFWHPDYGVIKVGKSQSNSKKRALEHIRDDTSNERISMATLKEDPNVRLILFNIIDESNLHWILSLEAFMEWNLSPVIHAARMG